MRYGKINNWKEIVKDSKVGILNFKFFFVKYTLNDNNSFIIISINPGSVVFLGISTLFVRLRHAEYAP